MTVIDAREVKIVKERIARGVEPQASAFQRLLRDADAAQSLVPSPPASTRRRGTWYNKSCICHATSPGCPIAKGQPDLLIVEPRLVEVSETWERPPTN
jgi:hypothetical protein